MNLPPDYREVNNCHDCHNSCYRESSYESIGFMQERVGFSLNCELYNTRVSEGYICNSYKVINEEEKAKELLEEEERRDAIYERMERFLNKNKI